MSGFDTNPFADPVDINPFQVGTGPGRPLPSPPPARRLPRQRDVALTEASLANGGAASSLRGQSARGGWDWGGGGPAMPGAGPSRRRSSCPRLACPPPSEPGGVSPLTGAGPC